MKYVVYWRCQVEGKRVAYRKEICENAESLATTIQNLQIDPQYMCIRKDIEIKVFPYFEEGQMALNTKTLQTRIVKSVITIDELGLDEGKLIVYNHDNPHEAELQKNGYMPLIYEEWDINDCIPVNWKEARSGHDFQFGTEMGKHPRYSKMQACEMSTW